MEPVLLQMGSGMGLGWGAGLFGWLTMLLVLIGIVAFLVWAPGRSSGGPDDAMEQLRARYAHGEISDEEFDERASRLQNQR